MSLRRKIVPAFTTPPTEVPPAVADEARINDVDRRLTAMVFIPRTQRHGSWTAQLNDLLDERNSIRPAKVRPVPVSPGRTS